MGFVFQVYNLLSVLTAVENVELPLLVSGVSTREARRRALAALSSVGLERRAKHRPSELSGGQNQRVAVARALVNRSAIVWADEPTGALDSEAAEGIMDLLCRLTAHGLYRERLLRSSRTRHRSCGQFLGHQVHRRPELGG